MACVAMSNAFKFYLSERLSRQRLRTSFVARHWKSLQL